MEKTELERLLELVTSPDTDSAGTSIRLPINLRSAANLAIELGLAESTTDLAVSGLRGVLEGVAAQAVLEQHYRQFPHLRPSLAEEALGLAEIDGNPLANQPQLLERAAQELAEIKALPNADEVLIYAAALAKPRAAASA